MSNFYEEYLKKEHDKKLNEYEKHACKITPDESLGDSVKAYYNKHGFI